MQSVPRMRGVDELGVFISKLEGVQVRTVWNSESGYIRIHVEGEHLPLDDEDMIRRMIARTDMLSVWSVLPQKAKVGLGQGTNGRSMQPAGVHALLERFDFKEIGGRPSHDGARNGRTWDENLNLALGSSGWPSSS